MVWLDAVERDGNSLYFDALRSVRRKTGAGEMLLLSGVLGDGSYEGEVQVNCTATGGEVIFADQWLAPRALADFFERIPRETVEETLLARCRQRSRLRPTGPRPHRRGETGSGVPVPAGGGGR
jgi:hypothetical protein